MEIRVRPRPERGRKAVARVLVAATVVLVVALLTPAALGLHPHAVADDSMQDTHPRGSLLLTHEVMVEEIDVGDVITFRRPGDGEWVTRRVVQIERDQLVTRGDAEPAVDPWRLPAGEGERRLVVHTLPWLGYPWLLAGAVGPLVGGLLLGGSLLAVLLLVAWLRRRRSRAPTGASVSAEDAPIRRVRAA